MMFLLLVILMRRILTAMMEIKGEMISSWALGYPLPKKDSFGHMPPHQNHCFSVIEKQLYPTDHVMTEIERLECFFNELMANTFKCFCEVDQKY